MITMLLSEAAHIVSGQLRGADARFTGCSIDSRALRDGELFVALRGVRYDGHDFVGAAQAAGARAALVQREIATDLPCVMVADTRLALGILAADWRRRFALPVIAVTGSNGKTTVKEMLRAIFSDTGPVLATVGNLNNDIGVPLTLFGLGAGQRCAVVEMGANHPGEIGYLSRMAAPDVAIITQCAPAHLEGFGSVMGVARAKGEIVDGLAPDGTAVINADDAFADLWRQLAGRRRILSFGLRSPADVRAEGLSLEPDGSGSTFELVAPKTRVPVRLPLPGEHNVMNALAAAAAALAASVDGATISAGLARVRAVPGRLAVRRGLRGSRIWDDTYNANPGSLAAALKVLGGDRRRHWLVLGDMGELGVEAPELHAAAGVQARESGVERLFTLGTLSGHAARAFGAGAEHHTECDALIARLRSELAPDVAVLVKGSRLSRMERVVAALTEEP
jgi:UDP-N-acetylmuramoyl-tripeptide--D-alanyl-D-alanine ligase